MAFHVLLCIFASFTQQRLEAPQSQGLWSLLFTGVSPGPREVAGTQQVLGKCWLVGWMKLSWWAFQVRGLQSCPTVFMAWYSMVDRAGGGPLLCVAILCGWTLSLSLSSVQKWILCPCHLVHMCTCLSRVDNKKWHSWVVRSAWF